MSARILYSFLCILGTLSHFAGAQDKKSLALTPSKLPEKVGEITIGSFELFVGVAPRTADFTMGDPNATVALYRAEPYLRAWLDRLVKSLGAQPESFEIVEVGGAGAKAVQNANAQIDLETQKPLILYNRSWLQEVIQREEQTNKRAWSARFIILHELGHIVNHHVTQLPSLARLSEGKKKDKLHRFELEADQFAGFHLARFGCSLEESEKAFKAAITTRIETETHPSGERRLWALKRGWSQGAVGATALPAASTMAGPAPLVVKFSNKTDRERGYLTHKWEFGDESESTEQSPTHIYDKPGTYRVHLTVTGPSGQDHRALDGQITVYEPISADFAATPTRGPKPLEVTFSDRSTGDATAWKWFFGDGGTSEGKSVTHTFEDAGKYTVRLVVTGPGGTDTEKRSEYLVVEERDSEDPQPGPQPKLAPLQLTVIHDPRGGVRIHPSGEAQVPNAGRFFIHLSFSYLPPGAPGYIPLRAWGLPPRQVQWTTGFVQADGATPLDQVAQLVANIPYQYFNLAPTNFRATYNLRVDAVLTDGVQTLANFPSQHFQVRW